MMDQDRVYQPPHKLSEHLHSLVIYYYYLQLMMPVPVHPDIDSMRSLHRIL